MKKYLTSEEILKLPKDEFIKYMEESKKNVYRITFYNSLPNTYQEFSFKDKVKYWTENLNQGMRLQTEKGFNPYLVFSSDWYEAFNTVESEVDIIIDEVFDTFLRYGWSWQKEEYLKRIKKKII